MRNASSMKVVIPKPQCHWSLLPHLWSCYMLTLPALRPQWNWITPQMWWTFWSSVTTLWNMSWHMWPLIKLWKLLLCFCGKDTSWSLEHWPSSWVNEEPTLKATSSESFVSLWAYGRLGLHLTMLKPMDRENELIKCWCAGEGNKVRTGKQMDRKQTGHKICTSWCMLTTLGDWPSPDIAHIIWCLGANHAYLSTSVSPTIRGTKTPVCWPLCHWAMWTIVGSL